MKEEQPIIIKRKITLLITLLKIAFGAEEDCQKDRNLLVIFDIFPSLFYTFNK